MLKLCSCNVTDQVQAYVQYRFHDSPGPFAFRRRSPVSVSCSPPSRHKLTPVQAVLSSQKTEVPEVVKSGSECLTDRLRLGRLADDGLSYKEKYIVRCYEVGINKTATIETLANLLQDVGCNHAQGVGFSTDGFSTTLSMRKLHLIWVTVRMHIEIHKYPAWSDVVEIETWAQSEGRIGARRDWILKDAASGQLIGRATGKWVMMNHDTRRLQKVSDEVHEEMLVYFPQEPRFAFPKKNNRSLKKILKLEDPAQYSRLALTPRRGDLDMNHHVNYVTYIGWVLESMPQEIIHTHELASITLDYRRECLQDDVVDSLTSPEPTDSAKTVPELNGTNGSAVAREDNADCPKFLHLLRVSCDGQEITRGRTEWRKKPAR
ncbi:fatA acyl-ACP thioesterase 1, fatA acyl-ACP thioesterase [Hibiscus trionum]|uniref:Acyl-[acyl-carrier-protein] hydrolase n=1 Tax=Hibiscus trionum TaxID=183268 RepID=A0A9W7ISH7_HIBTR|nr:fatA acyl-ACP thioesterase 1, fatA acyl-ACP thioesterase [Hibiscus trionum]